MPIASLPEHATYFLARGRDHPLDRSRRGLVALGSTRTLRYKLCTSTSILSMCIRRKLVPLTVMLAIILLKVLAVAIAPS
jgi:hypothetical protein